MQFLTRLPLPSLAYEHDSLARAVKLADLSDNADLRHVTFRPEKKKKDTRRVVRYAASYKFLTGQIDEAAYRDAMRKAE